MAASSSRAISSLILLSLLLRSPNRSSVELLHEGTRLRERGMRRFKSVRQALRFPGTHAAVYNLFNLGRHLVGAQHYRDLRMSAFNRWADAVG